jgi:hypothetical protein
MTDFEKTIEEARAAVLPANLRFDESWERLPGESSWAHQAFCVYRDYGPERNIRKALEAAERDGAKREKRYRMWRSWSAAFRWRERAEDYDRYTEKLRLGEERKTIEAQGERRRAVTAKMLAVVEKKLDLMDPAELTQGAVAEWVGTVIRADREAEGLAGVKGGRAVWQQGEINFAPEFDGV